MLSRVPLRLVAAIFALVLSAPALAQEAAPDPADRVSAPAAVAGPGLPTLDGSDGSNVAQRLITGVQAARCRPGRRADGSIIVCGGKEASEAERLPLHDQQGAAASTDDGRIHAPDVSGLRPCNGKCHGFGSAPAPMYYFDIAAMPPPPEGSDADRIAKGEIRAP